MKSTFVTIPNFLLCRNEYDIPGQEIILSTKSPFWFCQVYKFSSRKKMRNFLEKNGFSENSRVMGLFNVVFVPMGAMSQLPQRKLFPQMLLEEMGNFYAIEMSGNREFDELYFDKPKIKNATK